MQNLETKISRPRPKSFQTETETPKNGSQDQVSRLHHCLTRALLTLRLRKLLTLR